MAAVETDLAAMFADHDEMRRIVEEQNRIMGFVPDPEIAHLTVQEIRARIEDDLNAHGLRREDNIFSCGIIAARDEE